MIIQSREIGGRMTRLLASSSPHAPWPPASALPCVRADLLVEVLDVSGNRRPADAQAERHLAVGHRSTDEAEHLDFPRRQARVLRHGSILSRSGRESGGGAPRWTAPLDRSVRRITQYVNRCALEVA